MAKRKSDVYQTVELKAIMELIDFNYVCTVQKIVFGHDIFCKKYFIAILTNLKRAWLVKKWMEWK